MKSALSGNGSARQPDDPISACIAQVIDPKTGGPINASPCLSKPTFSDGRLVLTLTVDPDDVKLYAPVRDALEVTLTALPQVEHAFVVLSAQAPAQRAVPASALKEKPEEALQRQAASAPAKQPKPIRRMGGIDFTGIGAIIAVASGKGGVGKSTTTANLAVALKAQGLRVGVLDGDVYGPSIPRLFGVSSPPRFNDQKKAEPPLGHGIKVMSMGFLVEEGTAMVWRAPMVVSALTQMLSEVEWASQDAPLDVLLIDMPPGTGDTQLTISQQVPLDGAVIVSTPQDLALIDARKGITMFDKVHVPILGLVENMSTYICPACGHEEAIFGHGGAALEAEKVGVPFLGAVPLHIDIRQTSDAGTPIGVANPQGVHAKAYAHIAQSLWDNVTARRSGKRRAPAIIIEDEADAA